MKIKTIFYAVIIFLVITLIFSKSDNKIYYTDMTSNSDIFSYEIPSKLEFCGVKYDIDSYPFLRESIEREYYLILGADYQNTVNIKRMNKYFPIFQEYIKQYNLCDDLKYVSIVESNLQDNAYSRVGAAGIWQFMPNTGKQYGLKIDEYIDERLHIEKSTNSAMKYFSFLLNKFDNSYPLALSAYNMGESGLLTVMRLQKENDYFKLNLNNETSRYFPRALVMKYIYENKDLYKMNVDNLYKWPKYNVKKVIGPVDNLIEWSNENQYDYKTIRALNKWILGRKLPEGEWWLKVL